MHRRDSYSNEAAWAPIQQSQIHSPVRPYYSVAKCIEEIAIAMKQPGLLAELDSQPCQALLQCSYMHSRAIQYKQAPYIAVLSKLGPQVAPYSKNIAFLYKHNNYYGKTLGGISLRLQDSIGCAIYKINNCTLTQFAYVLMQICPKHEQTSTIKQSPNFQRKFLKTRDSNELTSLSFTIVHQLGQRQIQRKLEDGESSAAQ